MNRASEARVLLVYNRYQRRGGEDTVFEAESALLQAHGHAVSTLEFENTSIAQSRSPANSLRLAVDTVWSRASAARVAEAARAHNADVVHFHNTFPLVSPAAHRAVSHAGAAVVQRIPNYRLICPNGLLYREKQVCRDCVSKPVAWPGVVHACYRGSPAATGVVSAMQLTHRLMGTWQRHVDLFVSPSESTRQEYLRAGFAPEQVVVKPNFVEDMALPERRARDGFLFAGHLEVEKGVVTMLDAWSLLARGEGTPDLLIIGAGQLEDVVLARAEKLANVRYEGVVPRAEVLRSMSAASALVFPSEWVEPFGVTIVEAFAMGLPVIAGAIGAPGEIVEDGRTGLLFRPGDAADLAEKIAWAATHPAEMAAMGQAARLDYEEKYTAERNYELLLQIYEQALERRRGQK